MTLSIIPDFKRRRNRKTGVGRNVWGKCKCMYWLLQTAGLTWVGCFKQLFLVGRKQRLTEEKINITEKHHKQLLSLFSFSCDALKSHPSPRLGPLDTACIHLPFKVSSLSIFPYIYFLPVPRPASLQIQERTGLAAGTGNFSPWMTFIWFWQTRIISAEREIPLAGENKTLT